MKASACKRKKQLPSEELPAYLHSLADALESKTDHLPEELTVLMHNCHRQYKYMFNVVKNNSHPNGLTVSKNL